MRVVVIDAIEMISSDVAHSYLARKLSFPDYYGKNLDALHDCITDISDPTHIVLYHFTDMSVKTRSFLCPIIRTLKASVEENKNLTLSIDNG